MASLMAAWTLVLSTWTQCVMAIDMMSQPNITNLISGTVVSDLELTNAGEIDPYFGGHRKLMVTVYRPITGTCRPGSRPYMPPTTVDHMAPLLESMGFEHMSDHLKKLTLPVCHLPEEHDHLASYPILLFSHGLNSSRLLSSIQAQTVAMHGYTVIAIDHPGSARVVSWPDGTTSLSTNLSTNALIDDDAVMRSIDVEFVVRQLEQHESALYRHLGCRGSFLGIEDFWMPCNGPEMAMFGHSLGGATGLLTIYRGKLVEELAGVANLDGYPFGFSTTGATLPLEPDFELPDDIAVVPLLLFNEPRHTNAPSFTELLKQRGDASLQLELQHSRHWTFTDLPLLVDHFEMRSQLSPLAAENIGSITGDKAMRAIVHHLAAYFDLLLKGVDMLASSKDYPEVKIAREVEAEAP